MMFNARQAEAIPGYSIHFVFRRTPPALREALVAFWQCHRDDWAHVTRPRYRAHHPAAQSEPDSLRLAILSNTACVAFTESQSIAAVIWMKVARMPIDSEVPQLIYFQRMYVAPDHRCVRLTRRMLRVFHQNLIQSSDRSPLAKYLLAENVNPKLKTPIGRRHFIRQGFQFVGVNSFQHEIWKMPLPLAPARPVSHLFWTMSSVAGN